jgi:hypothetical protein
MMNVFWGLILFITPFLLIFCFTDKKRGFLYVFVGVIGLHLLAALITQSLHIFIYPVIITIHSLVAFSAIFVFLKYKKIESFDRKINWLAIGAFIIIIFELWSVHYFYSGSIGTITGRTEATKTSYPYPYFSDEWVGVSLVNYSLNNNVLSSGNSLTSSHSYGSFPNTLICWFALISELFLLVNLVPLTGYAIFALITGIIACLLIYLVLRTFGLKNLTAVLGTLCVPLITNGQNLPGIWYLIPFIGGLLMFLITLSALRLNDLKLLLISSGISLLLYPPMIIFIIPTLLGYIIFNKKISLAKKIRLSIYSLLILLLATIIIIVIQRYSIASLLVIAKSSLIYPLLDNGIVSYTIWNIIPWFILPFAFWGLFIIFKKKLFFLLAPIIIGLLFWVIYSQSYYFFVISYERAVVITSFLLIMAASFGFEELNLILTKKFPYFTHNNFKILIKIFFLLIFAYLALGYTQRTNWSKLTLNIPTSSGVEKLSPTPPASVYLTDSDLFLFKKISKQNFLATPWKGLTIGAATMNYPFDSKPSFITIQKLNYQSFIQRDCTVKYQLAKQYKLKYIYSPTFNCPNFFELGTSSENLHLYKFNP